LAPEDPPKNGYKEGDDKKVDDKKNGSKPKADGWTDGDWEGV
jgi:hypothetical protein